MGKILEAGEVLRRSGFSWHSISSDGSMVFKNADSVEARIDGDGRITLANLQDRPEENEPITIHPTYPGHKSITIGG